MGLRRPQTTGQRVRRQSADFLLSLFEPAGLRRVRDLRNGSGTRLDVWMSESAGQKLERFRPLSLDAGRSPPSTSSGPPALRLAQGLRLARGHSTRRQHPIPRPLASSEPAAPRHCLGLSPGHESLDAGRWPLLGAIRRVGNLIFSYFLASSGPAAGHEQARKRASNGCPAWVRTRTG